MPGPWRVPCSAGRSTDQPGWTLDARALEAALGVPVRLINDFHAQALAMPAIGAEHRVLLAPTTAATRPPGTAGRSSGRARAWARPSWCPTTAGPGWWWPGGRPKRFPPATPRPGGWPTSWPAAMATMCRWSAW
ncbi:MAG: glucokinase [bacterium]